MKKAFILILIGTLFSCNGVKRISVVDGHFKKGNEPYYFIGANYWYGPIIASEKLGNRTRLIKELDLMDLQEYREGHRGYGCLAKPAIGTSIPYCMDEIGELQSNQQVGV